MFPAPPLAVAAPRPGRRHGWRGGGGGLPRAPPLAPHDRPCPAPPPSPSAQRRPSRARPPRSTPRPPRALAPLLLALLPLLAVPAGAAAAPAAAAARGPAPPHQPVAFAGSGYLIAYYSGASAALRARGVLRPGSTPLSGASGGAFTAVLSSLGLTGREQFEFFKALVARDCRAPGCGAGGLQEALARRARGRLPRDAWRAGACRARG
jgi:hypothetical protein